MYAIRKPRLFAVLIVCVAVVAATLLSWLPQQQATAQPNASLGPSDEDRCPLWKSDKSDLPDLKVVGIPKDVCNTGDAWKDFGHMAWQTFKTLVWPAAGRGQPDKSLPIGHPTGSRVFETYKADWEIFLENAARPDDWQEYPKKASVCANADTMAPLDKDSLILASLHKFGNIDQVFGLGPPPLFHVLVSQKGSLVRYLTGFSEESFNTIQNNKLYEPNTVDRSDEMPEPPRWFKPGSLAEKFVGSINIKSAWIEIDPKDPEIGTFYTREAWVQDPHKEVEKRTCRSARVALVALHIAHKTKSSPQWIWASFEHKRNVPDAKEGTDGGRYTFHDGKGTNRMEDAPPPEARLSYLEEHGFAIPNPFNVERRKAVPQKVRDINHSWQQKLKGTWWENYELIAIQWPQLRNSPGLTGANEDAPDNSKETARPQPPCVGFHPDSSIANSVIETFLQINTDCKDKKSNLTCMSCHNLVRNYDFVWSIYAKDGPTAKAASSVLRQNIWAPQQ